MTSTEFTVGLNDGSKISSKVLKPPGGGSSDIFGVGNSYHTSKPSFEKSSKTDDSTTHSRVFGGSNPNPSTQPQSNGVVQSVFENGYHLKQNKKTYIRRNPITGEEIEMNVEAENEDKCDNKEDKEDDSPNPPAKPVQTSIRVRNPPGGKSSGIF